MEPQDIAKKAKVIKLKALKNVEQLWTGGYQSAFKGVGISFAEVRAYQYGDDWRLFDWNVTARFNRPHVKVFEEERQLSVILLVDVSQSTKIGGQHEFKSDMIAELCATLSYSAIAQQDEVGYFLFDQGVTLMRPVSGHRHQVLRIIYDLLSVSNQSRNTNIAQALRFASRWLKRKSLIFIISDFHCPDFSMELAALSKHHEVHGIYVEDVSSDFWQGMGIIKVIDPESGISAWIDTSDPSYTKQIEELRLKKANELQRLFSKNKGKFIRLELGTPWLLPLIQQFSH